MKENMKKVKEIIDTCNFHQLIEIRKHVDSIGENMNKGLKSLFE